MINERGKAELRAALDEWTGIAPEIEHTINKFITDEWFRLLTKHSNIRLCFDIDEKDCFVNHEVAVCEDRDGQPDFSSLDHELARCSLVELIKDEAGAALRYCKHEEPDLLDLLGRVRAEINSAIDDIADKAKAQMAERGEVCDD